MITTYNNVLVREALTSSARTNGTSNGVAVDTAVFSNNAREVMFIITTTVVTDGSHAISVEESDVVGSGYAAVDASRILGTIPGPILLADDDTFFTFGVRPTKRYVRLVVTTTTATTGGLFSAKAILANGSLHPVARS